MTGALAERFDRVLALDVSEVMLERARVAVSDPRIEFRSVSGERLDGVEDETADALVCYLVLQHLPRRGAVLGYLGEFARVLKPGGEAFVQLPVLEDGLRPRAWRALRALLVPPASLLGPTGRPEFRGYRLTRHELDEGLERAGLRVVATDTGPDAPYRYSRDLFLRLAK